MIKQTGKVDKSNIYNKLTGNISLFVQRISKIWFIPFNTCFYHFIMLRVKQGTSRNPFWIFGMIQPGIEPWSPRPWKNTQPTWTIYIWVFLIQLTIGLTRDQILNINVVAEC